MSRSIGKLHEARPGGRASAPARRSDSGIARAPGLVVASITAAVVFMIGHHLFPIRPRQASTPEPVATRPSAPDASQATAAAVPDAAALHDAATAEAG